ncbi:MAG: hypothetical protein PHC53_04785 [Patescibacteria group bacterium]|nr:hypothetical protein [Patescibacteria group bacterium]
MTDLSNKSFAELVELETALAQAKQNIRRRYRLTVKGLPEGDKRAHVQIAKAVRIFTHLSLFEARDLAREGYVGEGTIDLEAYEFLAEVKGIELTALE